MNQKEAQQLAAHIQREAPFLEVSLELVTTMVTEGWGVRLTVRSSNLLLGVMESPSQWDDFKQHLQKPPMSPES